MTEKVRFDWLNSPLWTDKQVRWSLLVLVLVLATGFWHDLSLLSRSPAAVGIDGYYYVLQIDELRGYSHLYFHTNTPFVLYALAGLSYLTSKTIIAIKLGSVIMHTLLCLGIFALVASTTRCIWLGVLGCALAAISGLHFYLLAEFINNLGAVTLLVWCGWSVTRAIETRRPRWVAISVILLLAATFSHRSALAIAIAVTLLVLLLRWIMLPEVAGKGYRRAALLIAMVLLLAPAALAAQPFIALPGWMGNELLVRPQQPFGGVILAEQLILLAVSPATLLLINLRRQLLPASASYLFAAVALWSLLITLNPFLNHHTGLLGIVGRLSGLAYIQIAILVPGIIWLLLPLRREAAFFVTALILPLMIVSVRAPLPYGMRPDYLLKRTETMQQLFLYRQQLGPSPIIIAPHGEQFAVTSMAGLPSQQRLPATNQYASAYWLLHRVNPQALRSNTMIILIRDENELLTVLIEDGNLRQQLTSINSSERQRLFATNPHLREAYYPPHQVN